MELNSSEMSWLERLSSPEYDQGHIVKKAAPELYKLKHLISQLESLNTSYPGGVLGYIKNARVMLLDSMNSKNPYVGYIVEKPECIELELKSAEFETYEIEGMKEFDKVAFVLVAGGMGERLGYSSIKLELPIDCITAVTYLEYYISMIQSCEAYAEKRTGEKVRIPFVIMTSDDTYSRTVQLLEENVYYGFPKKQVFILKQQKVPALINNQAQFSVKETGTPTHYELEMKPHGHGDIHTLLYKENLTDMWLAEGKKWVLFFQDTNNLVAHAIAPLLGVSKKHKFVMNSLSVPRKPGEAMGAICKLRKAPQNNMNSLSHKKAGYLLPDVFTINVEYNVLHPLLVNSGYPQGDVATDMHDFSQFPGNTNILCFELQTYNQKLKKTCGIISEFVNPKYTDATRTNFKSSTRLECMMQDFPKVLDPSHLVGTTKLEKWMCFSTVKNNIVDAAIKAQGGLNPECCFSGESDFYYANAKLLEHAARLNGFQTIDIPSPVPTTYLGITYQLGPKIIIHPSFGITLQQLKENLKCGPLVLKNASVILEGNIEINGLEVDGAVSLKAEIGQKLKIQNLKIHNAGIAFQSLKDENYPESLQIRGYYPEVKDITCLVSSSSD